MEKQHRLQFDILPPNRGAAGRVSQPRFSSPAKVDAILRSATLPAPATPCVQDPSPLGKPMLPILDKYSMACSYIKLEAEIQHNRNKGNFALRVTQ